MANNEFDITAKITNLDAIKKALSDITVNIKLESPELTRLLGFANSGLNIRVNLEFGPQLQQLLDLARDGIDLRPRGGSGSPPNGGTPNERNNVLSRGSALLATTRAQGDTGRFAGATGDLAVLSQQITTRGDRAFVQLTQLGRVEEALIARATRLSQANFAQQVNITDAVRGGPGFKNQSLEDARSKIAKVLEDDIKAQIKVFEASRGGEGFKQQSITQIKAQLEKDLKNASGSISSDSPAFSRIFPNASARGQASFDAVRAKQEAEDNLFAKYRATGAFSKINPGGGPAPTKGFGLSAVDLAANLLNLNSLRIAFQAVTAVLKDASDSAYAFERSAVGIGATLSAQTIRIRNGQPVSDIESSRLNLQEGFKTQDSLRKTLAPLGVSSEIGNAIGQGLTQGFAGTKGFDDNFIAKAGARIAAFTSIADAPLLSQSTRFFKDFSDITNQTPQAKNTQLGARLSKVAPEIFTAQTAEEFEKATQVLDKYVTALRSSNTALQASLEFQGALKNASIDLGEAINTTLAPGLKELAKEIEGAGVQAATSSFGKLVGYFTNGVEVIASGFLELANINEAYYSGLNKVGKAAFNALNRSTGGLFGKDQATDDTIVPNFDKRISNIGKEAGLDIIGDAQKRAQKVPDSTLTRIYQEALAGVNLPQAGEDPGADRTGVLRSGFAGNLADLAVKDQQRLSKSFNLDSAGSNQDFLKSNVEKLEISVKAQQVALEAAKTELINAQASEFANPSKDQKAVKAATEKIADAEKTLTERRVEATKGIIAQADGLIKLASALRATIETTTQLGKSKSLKQLQSDLNDSDKSNKGLFKSGKIDSTELDLRTKQNALQRFNAGVEQERQPGQNALLANNVGLTKLQLQNLPDRQAIQAGELADRKSSLERQLANFKEDKNLRRLNREEGVVSAATAVGATGGELDESTLPKQLSALGRKAAIEEATKALTAFKDKVAETTESLGTFENRTKLRRFEREANVIAAAQAVTASGGTLDRADLSGLSRDAYREAIKGATVGIASFGTAITSVTGSILAYNNSLQKIIDSSNKVYGDLNADAQKSGNNTSAFQIARNKASEEADRQATEAIQASQTEFYNSRFATVDNTTDNAQPGDKSSFTGDFNIEKLKAAKEDFDLGTGQDARRSRSLRDSLPGAKNDLDNQVARENQRVAGRDVKQGPKIDEETQRGLQRAIASVDLDLKELPLRQLIETITLTNQLLEGKQGLGVTKATSPVVNKDGTTDSGNATGKDKSKNPGGKETPKSEPTLLDSIGKGAKEAFNALVKTSPLLAPFTIPSQQQGPTFLSPEITPGNLKLGSDLFGAESGTAGPTVKTNARGTGIASEIIKGLVDKAKPSDNTKSKAGSYKSNYEDNIFSDPKDNQASLPLSKQDLTDSVTNGVAAALTQHFV